MTRRRTPTEDAIDRIIHCRDSRINEVDLSDIGLKQLPLEILLIKRLATLFVRDNELASIPREIGHLSYLRELSFARNQISELPEEIGRLIKLKHLALDDNLLKHIPAEIAKLESLEELYLQDNVLTELPREMCQLSQLSVLFLHRNRLQAVPKEIGQLKDVKSLSLQSNQLATLPIELKELRNLECLFLHDNPLLDIPLNVLGPTWSDVFERKPSQRPAHPEKIMRYFFSKGRKPVLISAPKPKETNGFTHGRALVIGVANYPKVSKLPEIVLDDARDVETLLKSPQFCGYPEDHVDLLLDSQATREGIRSAFERLARTATPGDTVVVFFSGHGGRVESGPDAGNYLIPFDCDPKGLKATAVRADELTALLSAVNAGRLVVLLDACHSGDAGEVKAVDPATHLKAGLDQKTYSLLAQGAGRVIVASSRSTEVSLILQGMVNSLFTHYLLAALKGAALVRGDGLVRVFDVFHYVSDMVPSKASQHPIFKAHDVENNFPLALDRGGKAVASMRDDPGLVHRPGSLSGKARIEIRKGLVSRWIDLADYFEVPIVDRSNFGEGGDAAKRLLDWLEERSELSTLRDAFNYLCWDDLVEVLNRYP